MHFQGRFGSDPALHQAWSPFLASQVVAGVTVDSAKSFRTFSRNYPDHLVLIMALASPQTSVGVCSHHQEQWDPVDPPDMWDIGIAAIVSHVGKLRHEVGRKSPVQGH